MIETLQWVALGLGWALWVVLLGVWGRRRIVTPEWTRNQFPDEDRQRLCAEVTAAGACSAMLGVRVRFGYAWFLAEAVPGGEVISSSGWCLTRAGISRRGYGAANAAADARRAARASLPAD